MCTINSHVNIQFEPIKKEIKLLIHILQTELCASVISVCDFWTQLWGNKGKTDTELEEIVMLISCFYSLKAGKLQAMLVFNVSSDLITGSFISAAYS